MKTEETTRRVAAKVEKMEDRPLKKQLESLCRAKKGTGSTKGMTILTIKNPTEANAEAVDLLVRSMFSTVIHPSFGVYCIHGDAEGVP